MVPKDQLVTLVSVLALVTMPLEAMESLTSTLNTDSLPRSAIVQVEGVAELRSNILLALVPLRARLPPAAMVVVVPAVKVSCFPGVEQTKL